MIEKLYILGPKMAMRNIAISLTLGPRSSPSGPLPPLVLPSQPVGPVDPLLALGNIPGVDILRSTPGIQPFLLPGLIPDLLYLAQLGRLPEAIQRADPRNPSSIIFNDPSQRFHEETKKVEMDILTGNIDVAESDIECINPKCKTRSVIGPILQQRRRADEPPTGVFRCTRCRQQWAISMA